MYYVICINGAGNICRIVKHLGSREVFETADIKEAIAKRDERNAALTSLEHRVVTKADYDRMECSPYLLPEAAATLELSTVALADATQRRHPVPADSDGVVATYESIQRMDK